ncbi:MAG TPA: site-2 protease family protein [Actinomycetales bacterium]|nr:site-2 protease family protein [Actinomycetales bacterium]
MTTSGWQIGRLLGVPVVIAKSWFVIAAVVTFLFSDRVRAVAPDLGVGVYLVAFGFAVLLFASVLVHELAHAVTARATGLPATEIVLHLWGGHTQFESEAISPGRSALVAVVGPLSNVVLAVPALLVFPALDGGLTRLLVLAFAYTNGFVAVFNAVPGLPLDGGRVLEALVWRVTGDRHAGTIAAGWGGRVVAVAIGLWALLPVLTGGSPDLVTIVWAALIGGLLWNGASQAIKTASVRRRAPRAVVANLAQPAVGVPVTVTLAEAMDTARRSGAQRVVLVGPDGGPVAIVEPAAVEQVPADRAGQVAVASVARRIDPRAVVDVSLAGESLLQALGSLPGEQFVALDAERRVVGVLHAQDVVDAVVPRRGTGSRR